MRDFRRRFEIAAGLALLLPLAGAAGVVIEQEQRQPGSGQTAVKTTLYVEAGKLRVETHSADGEQTVLIFDQSKQVVWVIDSTAGTYYEMTPGQMQRMKQRMDQARRQMEAQLAQLPAEQRRMIEEMTKQQMGQAPAVTVEEVARGVKVEQFNCTHYKLFSEGQLQGEVWAASFGQLQLQQPEYETFRALGRFFEPLGQSAPVSPAWTPPGAQIEGVPIRSVSYSGSRTIAEDRVVKVDRRSLEGTLFRLPAGLEKTEIEMGP